MSNPMITADSPISNSKRLADYFRKPAESLGNWKAEQCRRSLKQFLQTAWPIIEPSPLVWGLHVDAVCEHLEAVTRGDIQNLLITIPPRHGKSTIVSVAWPCWEWITCPELRWLFASYAESLAIRDNVRSRRLIQSAWYQRHWSHVFQFAGDQNQKGRIETDRAGHRIAVGTGGSATGEGGDRLVIDDPHNLAEVESSAVRKGTLEWFDTVWSTRANDPKTTARIIIMQRSHCDDLAAHVLEQGGWEYLSLPAEFEGDNRVTSIGWSDPRTEMGQLLWPEQLGPTEIAVSKRVLGSYAYSAQFQQRPSPAGGGIIKRHWFRYWQPKGMNLPPVTVRLADGSLQQIYPIDLPDDFDNELESWDLAFKDLSTSDFVAGGVWAAKKADRFLLDQVRERLSFPRTLEAVKSLRAKWPRAYQILIEEAANGAAVIATLRHEVSGIVAVHPAGGKIARAQAVSPQIESCNVYLPHPALVPWVDAFIEECAVFPNGKHDDQVDQMSQALNRLNTGLAYGLLAYEEELAADPMALERLKQPAERLSIARFGVVPKVDAVAAQPAAGACPECGATCIQSVSSGGKRCGMCGKQFGLPGLKYEFPSRKSPFSR